MRRTAPRSAEIQQQIDLLPTEGVRATDAEGALSRLARLGARPMIQRAVEEELDAFLGRERWKRRIDALPGKRNGWRPRQLTTAEGELEIPQLREAAEPFTSKLFPRESKRSLGRVEVNRASSVAGDVQRDRRRRNPGVGGRRADRRRLVLSVPAHLHCRHPVVGRTAHRVVGYFEFAGGAVAR